MEKEVLWRDMPSMENNFAFFEKIYALWLREFKVFLREKSRLVASTQAAGFVAAAINVMIHVTTRVFLVLLASTIFRSGVVAGSA